MSYTNLKSLYRLADRDDIAEGLQAYTRYNIVLTQISNHYGFQLDRTIAAFAALSPNNDYVGNLRSLVSLLAGLNAGTPLDDITVSTYRACLKRAHIFATGQAEFLAVTQGPKTRAFYSNLLDPTDPKPVTIDGHMVGAFRGNAGTMKDNLVQRAGYEKIAKSVRLLARKNNMLPNQMQAILWFTRKRVLNVKYDSQLDLFARIDDKWGTLIQVENIRPFKRKP